MADIKAVHSLGWNEKDLKEYLDPATQPLLDKSKVKEIDTSDGIVVDTTRLDFYSRAFLLDVAHAFPISYDVKDGDPDFKLIKATLQTFASHESLRPVNGALKIEDYPIIYLINYARLRGSPRVIAKYIYRFRAGRLLAFEIWADNSLHASYLYDSMENVTHLEVWGVPDGRLSVLANFTAEGKMGPFEDWSVGPPVIGYKEYYLHGEKVNKQIWLDYENGLRKAVREYPLLQRDVGSLISDYTNF